MTRQTLMIGALAWLIGSVILGIVLLAFFIAPKTVDQRPERPSLGQLDEGTYERASAQEPAPASQERPADTNGWMTRDEPARTSASGPASSADPIFDTEEGKFSTSETERVREPEFSSPRNRLEYFCYEKLEADMRDCECLFLQAQHWFEPDELDFFSRFDLNDPPQVTLAETGFELKDLPRLSGKILMFERTLSRYCTGISLAR